MSETEPIPVIPVLSYANPIGGQPSHGRLILETVADGVCLRDSKTNPGLSKRTVWWIGITLLVGGLGMAVWTGVFLPPGSAVQEKTVAGFIAAAMGVGCVIFSRFVTLAPPMVRIVGGRIFLNDKPGQRGGRGRFSMSFGSTDLRTGQTVHNLFLHRRWRFSYTLFHHLQKDEALWALRVLCHALDNGPG